MVHRRLLLDTHVFLWWKAVDPQLKKSTRDAIATAEIVFVSAASAWEAGIKAALGRLKLPESMQQGVEDSGFVQLPVTFAHAELAATLPRHHDDPFDRMLIAQAKIEHLTLVTADKRLALYSAELLLA